MNALVIKRKSIISFIIFLIAACFLIMPSCQRIQDRAMRKIRTTLSKADMFISTREFEKAQEKSHEAIKDLNDLIDDSRGEIELRILRARAHITLFIAKNTLIIENAPIRRSSLVRIPLRSDYIGYDETLNIVKNDLRKVFNTTQKISEDQQASAHAMLATMLRLDEKTAGTAFMEYEKAIKVYEALITKIKNERKHFSPKTVTLSQLQDQITSLRLAQSEVALLLKQWNKALTSLEKMMGGKDIKYFDVQFRILEHNIARLEGKIREGDSNIDPRTKRLEKLTKTWSDIRKPRDQLLTEMKSQELELLQTDIKLTMAQNNLSYRVICYYNLGQQDEFERSLEVLHNYYPEIHKKLLTDLEYTDRG